MAQDDRRYTRTHEWLLIDGAEALVGITDHAAEQLGDVTFVDMPSEGQAVTHGRAFGSIESVKAVSDLNAPVDGTVLAVNDAVDADPALVNTDPYGEGWLIRLAVADPSQVDGLLSAADYEAFLAEQEN